MDRYTTESNFTMEDMQMTIAKFDELMPKWDSPELDDFMSNGLLQRKNINNIVLITPVMEMKNVPFLMTKYGKLKVQYSGLLPNDQFYLMDVPDYTNLNIFLR